MLAEGSYIVKLLFCAYCHRCPPDPDFSKENIISRSGTGETTRNGLTYSNESLMGRFGENGTMMNGWTEDKDKAHYFDGL